jgi:hypothetical protein
MLSVGLLIVQVSSVSCKTVCQWVKTNDIFMNEEVNGVLLLHLQHCCDSSRVTDAWSPNQAL